MVEDPSLPFPESVAASEIHKAGQRGAEAAMQLFRAMGVGASSSCWTASASSAPPTTSTSRSARSSESFVRLGLTRTAKTVAAGGVTTLLGPGGDAGLLRRRLHHRPRARRAQLRRRPAGVGPVRAAPDLLPRPAPDRPVPRGERRRRGGGLGGHGRPPLAVHRAPDRRRRHARRRVLHALQDAQEPDPRHQARRRRRQEVGGRTRPRPSAPSGTSRFKVVARRHRRDLRADDRALLLLHQARSGPRSWPRSSCSSPASSSRRSPATWSA